MKKMIAVGIITVLTLGLSGCNWFQSAEPAVPYPYENTKYGFALTFPITWGEIEDTEDGERLLVLTSEDGQRKMRLFIIDKGAINDAPAVKIGDTAEYDVYREVNQGIDILEAQGEDMTEEKALRDEITVISNTFKAL
ncbi:hypothetical protein ACFLZH_02695 [Patescibacteria group bacterium]